MRRGIMATALALLGGSGAALAQERPRLEPLRDFAGVYSASGGGTGRENGRPTELQLSWLAAERVLRVDRPGFGYALNDRRTGSVRVVMQGQRFALSVPTGAGGTVAGIPTLPGPAARFTRQGDDRVAGLRCTNWRFADGAHSGRLCLTDEGILLRGEGESGGRRGRIEATRVTVAPQDVTRFRLAPGTPTLPMPRGLLPPGG